MDSLPPVLLLSAALICSLIGRMAIMRPAFRVGRCWGLAVLCVPLAPFLFGLRHKEEGQEGHLWSAATAIFAVLFFAVARSTGLLDDPWQIAPEKMRPAGYAEHRTPEVSGQTDAVAEPEKPDDRDEMETTVAVAPAAVPAPPAAAPASAKKGLMGWITALVRPAPTPAPAPAPLTESQRSLANRQEFARLSAVYASLKAQRRKLKKGDQKGITAYNVEAANYQAALAAARAEQADLNKQRLAKK